MRNCFVPWCDQECRKSKRMMFNAPKDESLFQKWIDVLPKKRIFKKSDKICERHFISSEISTTFDHIINGELFKMPRGRPKLNENVIPSRNLPANDEDIQPVKRGRRIGTTKRKSSTKKLKIVNNENFKLITGEKNNPTTEVKKDNDIQSKLDECSSKDILNNDKIRDIENKQIAESPKSNEEELQDIEFFENIYEDIFEVVLPSTLWGIHRDPNKEFIVFSYYDPKFRSITKIVELTNKAILKIIICGKTVTDENYYSEITYDTITNILNETDQIRICKMAIENMELCQIKLANTDLNEEYCAICSELQSC